MPAARAVFPGRSDCASALSAYAELRIRTVLSVDALRDPARAAAVIDPDLRAWEILLDNSSSSVRTTAGNASAAADLKAELGRIRDRVRALLQAVLLPTETLLVGSRDDCEEGTTLEAITRIRGGGTGTAGDMKEGSALPPHTYVSSPTGCPFGSVRTDSSGRLLISAFDRRGGRSRGVDKTPATRALR